MRAWLMVMLLLGFGWMPAVAQQAGRAEDQSAFAAARAVTEPAARVLALRQFEQTYPESALTPRAGMLALETDLAQLPDRTAEIHDLAEEQIKEAPAGLERWREESQLADELAEAEPSGVDLPDADAWARAALLSLTEESFRREVLAAQARYKLGRLTAKQIHADYSGTRAEFLAAQTAVDLRTHRVADADSLLREAFALAPLSGKVNLLRGEAALEQHQDGEALTAFKRAAAAGALGITWKGRALDVYARGGGTGGEAGFATQVDAMYRTMYPAAYVLPARKLPAGGHTVLLELFTGSGCAPCVAPDLAVNSLLTTYSRKDLVVLEYDENVPLPDPLTSPSSVSRAIVYGVGSTPAAFLDGTPLPVPGATRDDVENVVIGFADALEQQAMEPAGVSLALSARRTAADHVETKVTLNKAAGAEPGRRLELHFALVQDELRYSGENGVRFHRMVVRAVERGANTVAMTNANTGGGDATASEAAADFDLPALTLSLRAFLDSYEVHNDRFGQVHFREKDFPLDPAHLGVAAWLADPATHEVVQSAYVPVAGSGA